MLESKFKSNFLRRVEAHYPDAVVMKNDTSFIQGFPDTTIFWRDRYAILEFKRSTNAKRQPHQREYIDEFSEWTLAAFVSPENQEEVFDALQRTFQTRREARDPRRKQLPLDEL